MGSAGTLELPQFKGRPGWEFTDLSGLDLSAYTPTGDDGTATLAGQPLFEGLDAPSQLPDGVIVMPIAEAAAEHGELLRRHLGTIVEADDIFAILNEQAEHRTGAFVYVPAGVVLEKPISLQNVQYSAGTHLLQRTLVVLEEGAQAEVWEQYLSATDALDGVFNVVTELVVGDGAHLRYVSGQALSESSWISERSGPRSGATATWSGYRWASARLGGESGWRPSWPARAPRPG